jgi:hypothetical protein
MKYSSQEKVNLIKTLLSELKNVALIVTSSGDNSRIMFGHAEYLRSILWMVTLSLGENKKEVLASYISTLSELVVIATSNIRTPHGHTLFFTTNFLKNKINKMLKAIN